MKCTECNGSGEAIYFVETDRDENTVTVKKRKCICRTCNGSGEMPMTNADRLRAMTDEQWVDWARRQMHCGFEHFPCDVVCRGWCDAASGAECERIIMRWLKQPAKE